MKTTSLILAAVACSAMLASEPSAKACSGSCSGRSSGGASTTGGSTISMMPKGKKIDAGTKTSIANVAGSSVTISKDKGTATYQVDSSTRIFVNGNAASVERLAKGMRVTVDASALKPTLARAITATSGS